MTDLKEAKKKLVRIYQLPRNLESILMANSKVGLVYPRTPGYENEGDITLCKFLCGFPHHKVFSHEYSSSRTAIKGKMELDRSPSRLDSMDTQWDAIQAYCLTLAPIASAGGCRAALWQHDSRQGSGFTECLDYLLKDMAKKHRSTLERLAREREAAVAAPIVAGNNCELTQCVGIGSVYCILICVLYILTWAL